MPDSDGKDCINYYQYHKALGNKRKHWVYSYTRNNANFPIFVKTNELSESKVYGFLPNVKRILFRIGEVGQPFNRKDGHLTAFKK